MSTMLSPSFLVSYVRGLCISVATTALDTQEHRTFFYDPRKRLGESLSNHPNTEKLSTENLAWIQAFRWARQRTKQTPNTPPAVVVFDNTCEGSPVIPSVLWLYARTHLDPKCTVVPLSSVRGSYGSEMRNTLRALPYLPSESFACEALLGGRRAVSMLLLAIRVRTEAIVPVLRSVLGVCEELSRLTSCSVASALAGKGKRKELFERYVEKNPALARSLSTTGNRKCALRGGKVIRRALVGLHTIAKGEIVFVFDFVSMYALTAINVLVDVCPELSRTFSSLVALRDEKTAEEGSDSAVSKAVKLFTNSIFYGCLAMSTGRFFNRELAACITRNARKTMKLLVQTCQRHRMTVLSGHTDSVIIHCREDVVEEFARVVKEEVCEPRNLRIKVDQTFAAGTRFLVLNRTSYAGVDQFTKELVIRGRLRGENTPAVVRDVIKEHFLTPLLCDMERDPTRERLEEMHTRAKLALRKRLVASPLLTSVSELSFSYHGKANSKTPGGQVLQRLPSNDASLTDGVLVTVREGGVGVPPLKMSAWGESVRFPDVDWYERASMSPIVNSYISAVLSPETTELEEEEEEEEERDREESDAKEKEREDAKHTAFLEQMAQRKRKSDTTIEELYARMKENATMHAISRDESLLGRCKL